MDVEKHFETCPTFEHMDDTCLELFCSSLGLLDEITNSLKTATTFCTSGSHYHQDREECALRNGDNSKPSLSQRPWLPLATFFEFQASLGHLALFAARPM